MKLTIGEARQPLSPLNEINAQINELLKASVQSEGVINLFDSKTVGEKFNLFDRTCWKDREDEREKHRGGNPAQADGGTGGGFPPHQRGAVAEVFGENYAADERLL